MDVKKIFCIGNFSIGIIELICVDLTHIAESPRIDTKKAVILSITASLFVIPAGFEPTTHSLEGCCSIQLSYGTDTTVDKIFCAAKLRHLFLFSKLIIEFGIFKLYFVCYRCSFFLFIGFLYKFRQ